MPSVTLSRAGWVASPICRRLRRARIIDAIPNAGRYDGTVGVLGGLEAIRALARSGIHPRRSIELLLFTAEEPTRFGIGCLGSRLLANTLDPVAAARLKGRAGNTLEEVRHEAGCSGSLADVPGECPTCS
jgi:ureidoglycolate amidohydrolase